MPSTSDKKFARAIMGRHEGVKYTEALRFVAELKEMRERNESRIALGAAPVIELDPQGSAWKIEESRRYFVTPGDPRIVIKLDEVHHLSGGREAFTSWFEAIQRAARVASGQARDEERRLALTRALMQTSVRSKIMGPDEAREALREQRRALREQAEGRKDSGPGAPMFDEWHVMAHASRSRRRFGEMQRAVRAASSESRDDARHQQVRALERTMDSLRPIVFGNPGAGKSYWKAEQLARGSRAVWDPTTGELLDTSGPDSEA